MDATLRVITRLPLEELWRDDAFSSRVRGAALSADDIIALLRAGPVHFVVADVGERPQWIPPQESYRYWKSEVQPHLAAPGSRVYLDQLPDSYAYFATAWGEDAGIPIVVLEKPH
ncbi:MAG TPA: hypothetical protein VM940_02590 [Chthoniobacterales bacterium]|jgi:hypothetical protein|nr:hypothetical protein [Chthoniobacterales bacterium]